MTIGKHWNLWGFEMALFKSDPIDMEIGTWEIIAAKALLKVFGLNIVLAGLEVSDSRATISALNCHLSVFWG
jgi:hypothetical protein